MTVRAEGYLAALDFDGLRTRARTHIAAGRTILGESECRQLLSDVVPFAAGIECCTEDEAAAAAEELGYPVVVKALSSAVVHKSEHGLVRLDCADAAEVRRAARELQRRIGALATGMPFTLSVQRQVRGVPLAIGLRRDPLGLLCMVSAGGTMIELLDDAAFEIAPVDLELAQEMIGRLRIRPLLDGYRGSEVVDAGAAAELIIRVSQLGVEVPELGELDLNPVFATSEGCRAVDARCTLVPARAELRPRDGSTALKAILEPRTVAVVGASDDERKVGGLVLRYLRKHRWAGEIIAVNRTPVSVDGVASYRSLSEVDRPVDLAVIAVPARAVHGVVEDCIVSGIDGGVILTAGFAESDESGRKAQERLIELTASTRFRFVGPNTIGVASPSDGMFATFGMALEAEALPGSVGFVSQSGAIASSLVSRAAEFGIGFSHWISAGNEADLGLGDFIGYLAADEKTTVICLFIETIRRPAAFTQACRAAARAGKPIVSLRTGRSEAGQAAAISHTGALAGSDVAYDAFLRRCGVIQVADLPGLLAAAQGLQAIGPVNGRRVGIVSMSGGACSMLADGCADAQLEVPQLSGNAQARLRELLPVYGGVRNPIDVTASGIQRPELVGETVEILRELGEMDIIIVQLSTNADPAAARMAADLVALSGQPGTPLLVGRLGAPTLAPEAMKIYAGAGVHVFGWPGQLVEAARACIKFGAIRRAEVFA
jgi:acetate---CoA ligase (ADP-forming)